MMNVEVGILRNSSFAIHWFEIAFLFFLVQKREVKSIKEINYSYLSSIFNSLHTLTIMSGFC